MSNLATKLRPITTSIFKEISQNQLKDPNTLLRHKKWLPGNHLAGLPEYVPCAEKPELKVLTSIETNVEKLGGEFRKYIDAHLYEHTAFLLRGTPIRSAREYATFFERLGYAPFSYEGGTALRAKITGAVYNAGDDPAQFTLDLHNEMSYLKVYPSKIMFCCVQPAQVGGENPIVFNRELIKLIPKDIVNKLNERKVRYIKNLAHQNHTKYNPWQEVFATQCQKEATKIMEERLIEYLWHDNGDLQIWAVTDPLIEHPVTKETVWFNQAHGHHCTYFHDHPLYEGRRDLPPEKYVYHTTYGDGKEIEDDVIDLIRTQTWLCAKNLKLDCGDVLFLDNHLVQHTRMGFEGTDRNMLVAMSQQ